MAFETVRNNSKLEITDQRHDRSFSSNFVAVRVSVRVRVCWCECVCVCARVRVREREREGEDSEMSVCFESVSLNDEGAADEAAR